MTDQEVLTRCIEIALDNHWKTPGKLNTAESIIANYYYLIAPILFDHDFCRALFGEGKVEPTDIVEAVPDVNERFLTGNSITRPWRYHIQQLALAEDRIGYLGKWLEGQG